jgi:16S rRNA (adenine1518-N6/adenine1519-N6)-dimethyltransferase
MREAVMETEHREPRQTQSYLRELFEQNRIRPRNKLGQNFLIDLNLIDLIVRTAELGRDDLALEVGSGTGSLTARLAVEAGAVVSVEIDAAFHALVAQTLSERDNVRLLHADVLRRKNELNPDVLAAVDEMSRQFSCRRIKLIANLPYAVATPVIANLLLLDLPLERMVVTVQWEIAERLMAEPGTKDYGALTVLVHSLAEVRLVRRLPPSVFWPRPQVASAIVLIRPDVDKRGRLTARLGGPVRFRNFLRELYVHRRKNLRGGLIGLPSRRREKAEVDQKLADLRLDGTIRAEALDVEQHVRLCEAFG